ncbi:sulfur oxidation c-type cytochrome SoxX [Duganella callida]|nr:sulfur oxidation c-type cytochrome SoxX [Duganella callida]
MAPAALLLAWALALSPALLSAAWAMPPPSAGAASPLQQAGDMTAQLPRAAGAVSPGYVIKGDGIPALLAGAAPGDAARGRAIVANRQVGLCLLCHTGPIPEERFQGNLAPDLQGAGARWSAAQLRLRIVDAGHFNPSSIMPSYYRTEGLNRVAAAYQGKTILDAQQIEDVVAWLQTLREPAS